MGRIALDQVRQVRADPLLQAASQIPDRRQVGDSPVSGWHPYHPGQENADSIRAIVRKRAAAVDGITGRIGGHSLRVGSARELAADGASLVELQQAGGWRSPTTPAVYVRRESATRGPVTRRRYGVGQ